jgi:hypothetical protein
MKITKKKDARRWTAVISAGLALVIFAGQVSAKSNNKPERVPLWYEGTTVSGMNKQNETATVNIPNDLPAHVLQPFYFIITPGMGRLQDPVIGVIPGDVGYTGWWNWSALLDFSGRDLAADPYTSAGEVAAAICTITGFPANITACRDSGTPLIDVTGVGGETDFVFAMPVVYSAPLPPVCE